MHIYVREIYTTHIHTAVSYTHLDVYKRQVFSLLRYAMATSMDEKDAKSVRQMNRTGQTMVHQKNQKRSVIQYLLLSSVTCLLYTSRCV